MDALTALLRSASVAATLVLCATAVAEDRLFFDEPVSVGSAVNSQTSEWGGSMTADGLQLFFFGKRDEGPGGTLIGADIICATRDDPNTPFDDPEAVHVVHEVSSASDDIHPFISADGRALYFTRGWSDIFVATREDAEGPFESVVPLAGVNSGLVDIMGTVSCDGTLLFFSRGPGGGVGAPRHGLDLLFAIREDLEDPLAFTDPRPVSDLDEFGPEVDSGFDEIVAALHPEGFLFYGSWPAGWGIEQRPGGHGGSDIWMAIPGTGEIVNGGPLVNSPQDEMSVQFDCGRSRILFASFRDGGHGGADIYTSAISRNPPCTKPPAVIERRVERPRDAAEHCGDFVPGDEIAVELAIAEIRGDGEDCERVERLVVRERPPEGWDAFEISDGGRFENGVITWEIAEPVTLRYRLHSDDTVPLTATWSGDVAPILEGERAREIAGDDAIGKVTPFDECGNIHCWNILGAFEHDIGFSFHRDALARDYLTDGDVGECDLDWSPGTAVDTDFAGDAAAIALLDDAKGRNPGGTPTVFAWNDADGLINLGGIFGGDPNRVMAYAQIWVVNTTDEPIEAAIDVSSDDAVRVLLDDCEEVAIDVRSHGVNLPCTTPHASGFVTLDPGAHSLLVKVFEGGGDWQFWLRLVDPATGEPFAEGIELRKTRDTPPARFVRGDCNGDGEVNISDPSYLLNWLFLGGPPLPCEAAGDANGDGTVDISDASYLLNFLFLGGPAPVAPFPECGPLPEDEALSCDMPPEACR